jgi:hypothetical protein
MCFGGGLLVLPAALTLLNSVRVLSCCGSEGGSVSHFLAWFWNPPHMVVVAVQGAPHPTHSNS